MRVAFSYVTDERGFDLASLSAMSVALSQPPPCRLHIFCYEFLPEQPGKLLEATRALGAQLSFARISDAMVKGRPTRGRVSTPALLKLPAVASLIRDYDRVVYFDNDVLVFKDLQIGGIEFGDTPLAAVTDMDLSETGVFRHWDWKRSSSQDVEIAGYFNSGVLIFESRNWKNSILSTFAAALNRHDRNCAYKVDCALVDQCPLNETFENNWVSLPAEYNMQASAKFTAAWKTAAVRHYCGSRKYVPLSLFRSDSRDVLYVNRIRRLLGMPTSGRSAIYEMLFMLNSARNYRESEALRRFLSAHAERSGSIPLLGLELPRRGDDGQHAPLSYRSAVQAIGEALRSDR